MGVNKRDLVSIQSGQRFLELIIHLYLWNFMLSMQVFLRGAVNTNWVVDKSPSRSTENCTWITGSLLPVVSNPNTVYCFVNRPTHLLVRVIRNHVFQLRLSYGIVHWRSNRNYLPMPTWFAFLYTMQKIRTSQFWPFNLRWASTRYLLWYQKG